MRTASFDKRIKTLQIRSNKMIKLLLFSATLLICYACQQEVKVDLPVNKEALESDELSSNGYDTILESGYFYQIQKNDSGWIYIHWGNESFERSYFYDYTDEDIHQKFEMELQNYLSVRSWSGHFWSLKLLPKNQIDSIKDYSFPICIDSASNLVLWKRNSTGNDFQIDNMETGNSMTIQLDSLPAFGNFMEGIDSTSFTDNKLFIRWKVDLNFSESAKLKEAEFEIKI